MAFSKESWETAKAMFEAGKSLSKISEATNISRGQISKRSKREEWGKETLKDLATAEVLTIMKKNEIDDKKATLTKQQRKHYDDVFIDLKTSMGVFNSSALRNQHLVNKAQEVIHNQIDADADLAIHHLPNLMAISKTTESNRKQVLGATETYKEAVTLDDKPKRVGMGDLYKVINNE